jgi:polyphosphate glucokinase
MKREPLKILAVDVGGTNLKILANGQSEPRKMPSGPRLTPAWVGFDFAAAFGMPVKVANDAAMQALGSYDGGRMLFLGLGTGVGAALIADRAIVPMEVSALPWRRSRESVGDVLSGAGLERTGVKSWRKTVNVVACCLMKTFLVDYVVIGGGNARKLRELPHGLRLGHNLTAFRGGYRLWDVDELPIMAGGRLVEAQDTLEWRVL